jgi:hypothetical protein
LSVQQEPFFEAYRLNWSGLLYSAAVKDDRIAIQYKLVDVMDTLHLSPFAAIGIGIGDGSAGKYSPRGRNQDKNDNDFGMIIPAISSPTDAMYAIVQKPLAPAKFYTDLNWTNESWDIHLHSHSLPCIEIIQKVWEISSPANLDPSPALSPWDNLRYQFHGMAAFKVGKITIVNHSQDYLHQNVQMKLSLVNTEWTLDNKSFDLLFHSLELVAEMTNKILPTRGRNTRKPKIVHTVSKICEIPSFVLAVVHEKRISVKDSRRSRLYSHHDVYLYPALQTSYEIPSAITAADWATGAVERGESDLTKFFINNEFVDEMRFINNDRFFHFRTDKLSGKIFSLFCFPFITFFFPLLQ